VIDNVLDAFDAMDPSKITTKPKIHTLTHLPDNVRRFGPAVRNSTEVFEAFNAIFRFCVVLSNRQADSRDTARKFRSLDTVKHLLTGGWYSDNAQWTQPGSTVRRILRDAPNIQNHLGWSSVKASTPGHVTRLRGDDKISPRFAVEAKSGNVCRIGSWIVSRHEVR
jgi:hypothetical protein